MERHHGLEWVCVQRGAIGAAHSLCSSVSQEGHATGPYAHSHLPQRLPGIRSITLHAALPALHPSQRLCTSAMSTQTTKARAGTRLQLVLPQVQHQQVWLLPHRQLRAQHARH